MKAYLCIWCFTLPINKSGSVYILAKLQRTCMLPSCSWTACVWYGMVWYAWIGDADLPDLSCFFNNFLNLSIVKRLCNNFPLSLEASSSSGRVSQAKLPCRYLDSATGDLSCCQTMTKRLAASLLRLVAESRPVTPNWASLKFYVSLQGAETWLLYYTRQCS